MQAIQFSKFSDDAVLQLENIERPRCQANDYLIAVEEAAVNPIDSKIRDGSSFVCQSLSLPSGLGFDFCGRIIEAPDGGSFKINDRVFGVVLVVTNILVVMLNIVLLKEVILFC